jgi:16S rRNA (uracil1498-N3)-methyltransferase
MSTRFYINWPLAPGPATLTGVEAHHAAAVCRLRPGDAVCLFNGDGHEYAARILEVGRRSVSLEIDSVASPARELPFTLEVAAPLPKGDRAQFLIEKLTELGATTFVPLGCSHSATQQREAKPEKLQRYVIEASKQCGRNVLMRVEPMVECQSYFATRQENEARCVAHPGGNSEWAIRANAISNLRIAAGPEGGFTNEEIGTARANGWSVIDLGPRILRVETAALAMACRAIFCAKGQTPEPRPLGSESSTAP